MSNSMFIKYDNVNYGVNYLQQIANEIDDLNIKKVTSEILEIDNFISVTEFENDLDQLNYRVNEISANIISTKSLTMQLSEKIIKYTEADAGMKRVAFAEGASGVLEGLIDGMASIIGQGVLFLGYEGAADKIFSFVETNWTEKLLDGAYSKYEAASTMTRNSEKLDLWKGIGSAAVYVGLAVAGPGLSFEAITSGIAAHGQTVQTSLQDGDDYQTALNKGYEAGAVAAVSEVVMDKTFSAVGKVVGKGVKKAAEGVKKLLSKGTTEAIETIGEKTSQQIVEEVTETAGLKATQQVVGETIETGENVVGVAAKNINDAAEGLEKTLTGSINDLTGSSKNAFEKYAKQFTSETMATASQKTAKAVVGETFEEANEKTVKEVFGKTFETGENVVGVAAKNIDDAAKSLEKTLTGSIDDLAGSSKNAFEKYTKQLTGEAIETTSQKTAKEVFGETFEEANEKTVKEVFDKTFETGENVVGVAAKNIDDAAEGLEKTLTGSIDDLAGSSKNAFEKYAKQFTNETIETANHKSTQEIFGETLEKLSEDIPEPTKHLSFSKKGEEAAKQLSEYYGDAGGRINDKFKHGKTVNQILNELDGHAKIDFQDFLQNTRQGKYLSSLSDGELAAMREYTGGLSYQVNGQLREKTISGAYQSIVENVDSAIAKFGGLDETTEIYRGVRLKAFSSAGSEYHELIENTDIHDLNDVYSTLKQLEGKKMSDLGYLSASPSYSSSFAKDEYYPIVLDIVADKGTPGAYIDQISNYYGKEHEFLFARGTVLQIEEVLAPEIDINGLKKVIVKCAVK